MPARPTAQQLRWQESELSMFLHFGINTFTNREWGDGTEDPHLFNPTELDARQWVDVAKSAGFNYLILTAKHHDGFCLWPSGYTEHSVKNSSWRDGKGDVVREFAEACRQVGVNMGIYLSPWDRHEMSYGNSTVYNRFFKNQLTELLTHYGPIAEIWFDGACGEGPNGKRQEYDWQGYYRLIRRLQQNALIAICGPDIRWVGNEDGFAHETEWSVQEAHPVSHEELVGQVWHPAECDVSIRPGWFWHKNEDDKLKTLEHLMEMYYSSVGRNAVLLLNVPPDDRGLIAEPDVSRLREFRDALDRTFAENVAIGKKAQATSEHPKFPACHTVDGDPDTYWTTEDDLTQATLEIDLGRPVTFNLSVVQEYITLGQRVESYRLEYWTGKTWKLIHKGTTIGHKKIDRFSNVTARKVRFAIKRSREAPIIRTFGLYRGPKAR